MFLNAWGQPIIIQPEITSQQIVNDLVNSPLILCHKDGLLDKLLPTNWSGCLYTTENVDTEALENRYKMPPTGCYSIEKLKSNEPKRILLSSSLEIILTPVSLDAKGDHIMFIIQDNYVNSLVTDNFTSVAFDALVHNKLLRKVIVEDTVDVLYINDAVYKQMPSHKCSYPSEILLRSLVSLLKPRFVRGIWSTPLPQYLLHECSNEIN